MEIFLIILLIIDIIMIGIFIFFYIKFKKIFELPWEDIKESIKRAQELVNKLEKLRVASEINSKIELKKEIYSLAKKGYTPKEIAKKLKLSEAEVELILASKKIAF
ncbi:MAG: hypothetical protein MW689_000074 [Thermodesulfobacteria bacterium]|nr:hypothetical protein [Thermodesulfobacteriota bacterium]MCU4138285.1 hypothetical protein [Thermodesulfobacteriota bacterium]